jgi:hypothetical protein
MFYGASVVGILDGGVYAVGKVIVVDGLNENLVSLLSK